jgi:glycosyltransferase involved in cell wall biosynthesis
VSGSKLNICFFNSCKTWGGGEKWHFDVASNLSLEQFNVILFSNPGSKLLNKAGDHNISTIRFTVNNLSFINPIKVNGLTNIFRKHNFDAIILNLPNDLKLAGLAAKKANIKRIIYRRGSAIPIKNNLLNRYYFKNIVTDIIANSEETKNTILKNNKSLFNPNKIQVIYNGIELEKFPEKNNVSNQYNQRCEIAIGNIGRLDPQKAQHYFIELSKELEVLGIKHKIYIAGDGPLKSKLNKEILSNNLSNNIKLLGFIEDIPSFLKEIDLFVLTSLWEGFGYVIAESMAAYKPAIAFNLSSNPELIDHNKTGFLIDKFEIKEIAKSIQTLIVDEEKYKEFAMKGRDKVERLFSKQKMIENVSNYLFRI